MAFNQATADKVCEPHHKGDRRLSRWQHSDLGFAFCIGMELLDREGNVLRRNAFGEPLQKQFSEPAPDAIARVEQRLKEWADGP